MKNSAGIQRKTVADLCPEAPPFRPPFLLRNGHIQTVFGQFTTTESMEHGTPHRVLTSDGDTVVVHENRPATGYASDGQAVLLVHGLSGCHESGYIQRAGKLFLQAGWTVLRFDMRGCGASLRLSKGIFHAARTEDLRTVVEFLGQQLGCTSLTVVGYSLGANLLLRMLGELADGRAMNVRLGIAVAPPIDLGTCCRELQRGLGWGYDKYFVRRLWNDFQQRRGLLRHADRATARSRPKSLFDFDAQVTAPVGGFADVDAYYEAASSKPFLSKIKTPVHLLIAADDPIIPNVIYDSARFSDACQVFITRHGGHLGYVGGGYGETENRVAGLKGTRFMDQLILRWSLEQAAGPARSASVHVETSVKTAARRNRDLHASIRHHPP